LLGEEFDVLSVTFDNGKEFTNHPAMSEALGCPVFFANPHCPWERGGNENFNGLLRQYFEKGCSMADDCTQALDWALSRINHRPREILGGMSAYETYYGIEMNYCDLVCGVALRS
jgi:IS30 family transposase